MDSKPRMKAQFGVAEAVHAFALEASVGAKPRGFG